MERRNSGNPLYPAGAAGYHGGMEVKQFRFNHPEIGTVFAYLLFDPVSGEAAAVDGGAVEEMTRFLKEKKLTLKIITNTHRHTDHTGGDEALRAAAGGTYQGPEELAASKSFTLGDETVEVISTPGHSEDSVVFRAGEVLITGDTLFTGTVGNCYTRDYEAYFASLKRVTALPGTCRIYPGHDLREYAVGAARKLDPSNPHLEGYLAKGDPGNEYSLLEEERKVNPFIRWNDPALEPARRSTGRPRDTEFQRWRALMDLH